MTRRDLSLDETEVNFLRSQVRQALRKSFRTRQSMQRKLGDAYDSERYEHRIEFLEGLYAGLGGDPANITNYEREVAS